MLDLPSSIALSGGVQTPGPAAASMGRRCQRRSPVNPELPPAPPSESLAESRKSDVLPELVNQNIDAISAFHEREAGKRGHTERRLARVSDLVGRPFYLFGLMLTVPLWMAVNLLAGRLGYAPFDPAPFHGLHILLTLAALLTTSIVLCTQNHQAQIENQRAQLDLQVNLLTEQKVTKLIGLIEELRRDLPMVKDRFDPEAASLQQNTDATQVLTALASVEPGAVPGLTPPAASPG